MLNTALFGAYTSEKITNVLHVADQSSVGNDCECCKPRLCTGVQKPTSNVRPDYGALSSRSRRSSGRSALVVQIGLMLKPSERYGRASDTIPGRFDRGKGSTHVRSM